MAPRIVGSDDAGTSNLAKIRNCPNGDRGVAHFNAERVTPTRTRRLAMKRSIFDRPGIREKGARALFCSFLLAGAYLASTIDAKTQMQTGHFARECALKDITVITLIEDHGAAADLPADRLHKAALMQLRARSVCSEGRIREAQALYDSILDLRPVASAKR
nr:hypothetical protein [Neorhizobium tomejilense]